MFDYLKQVAEKQHVPESVLSDRETVIRVKTTPTNILVLQNNANTDTFYQEQVDKIMSYNPPLPPGGEGDGKPEPPKLQTSASARHLCKLRQSCLLQMQRI